MSTYMISKVRKASDGTVTSVFIRQVGAKQSQWRPRDEVIELIRKWGQREIRL